MKNQLQEENHEGTDRNWLIRTFVILPGLTFAFLLSGCMATVGLQGISPHRTEITVAQKAIVFDYVPEPRLLAETDWRPTLDRVIERIGPAARETCYSIGADYCENVGQHVHIVVDPTINAFVDTDNEITVHSGLLHYSANDEEIAAVLAHEYGHVFANHVGKRNQNASVGLLGALLVSFLGGYSGADDETTMDAAMDVYEAAVLANSPEFELEADYYAALILEQAEIDLIHGQNVLIRLARAHDSSTQDDWGLHGRLMATTHPADDRRIATWMAISDSLERSRQASPGRDDGELRWATLADLLKDPLMKGKTENWINPRNGHSGTMKILGIRGMVKCHTPSYHAQCVRYRQLDHSMEFNSSEIRFICTIPMTAGDETSWEWIYMGNSPPWKQFRTGCPVPTAN